MNDNMDEMNDRTLDRTLDRTAAGACVTLDNAMARSILLKAWLAAAIPGPLDPRLHEAIVIELERFVREFRAGVRAAYLAGRGDAQLTPDQAQARRFTEARHGNP